MFVHVALTTSIHFDLLCQDSIFFSTFFRKKEQKGKILYYFFAVIVRFRKDLDFRIFLYMPTISREISY